MTNAAAELFLIRKRIWKQIWLRSHYICLDDILFTHFDFLERNLNKYWILYMWVLL